MFRALNILTVDWLKVAYVASSGRQYDLLLEDKPSQFGNIKHSKPSSKGGNSKLSEPGIGWLAELLSAELGDIIANNMKYDWGSLSTRHLDRK